jgi:hypothetical protein
MSDYYILDGHDAVACDMMTWAQWLADSIDRRRVAATTIGDANISTVFLGSNHAFNGGPPMIFETMVFGDPLDQEIERCSTWEQAEAQHAAMCERVRLAMREERGSQAMKRAQLDCGEGWQLRVEMVDGRPLITAQHDDGEMVHASTVTASMKDGIVQFLNWHQESHSAQGEQAMLKDKVVLAKTETVYGEEPASKVIRADQTIHPPQVTPNETIYNFRLDCPNCNCGISVELRTGG